MTSLQKTLSMLIENERSKLHVKLGFAIHPYPLDDDNIYGVESRDAPY